MIRRLWIPLAALLCAPVSTGAQEDTSPGYAFGEDDLVIYGEVQKPEVTVVISRENLNKSYQLELKESFLPKILKSVEKAPF